MVYDIYKYPLRWVAVTLLAGHTVGQWLMEFMVWALPPKTPALLGVAVKFTVMLICARWFRSLLRKSPPVEVGEIRSTR